MKLEKWYFSNLACRSDKVDAQELVAAIQGFPPGVLTRFPVAVENTDLPDSIESLCQLMQEDGFRQWDYSKIKDNGLPLKMMASNWTKLKMLQHLIDRDIGGVLTTDNAYPIVPFAKIEAAINGCPADMKALYLHWVAEPHEPEFQDDHYEVLAKMEPAADDILGNFSGVGWIIYFTPEGAADFLSMWRQHPDVDGQGVLLRAFHAGMNPTGYYACNPHLALSIFDLPRIHKNVGVIRFENQLSKKDK